MAINDYILCKICGVKLLYDGAEEGSITNREWYKERFGKDIEMTCPPCDKLDADIEHTTEPVAWRYKTHNRYTYAEENYHELDGEGEPLYTSPQKREPLSYEDVRAIVNQLPTEVDLDTGIEFCKIIEKAHGIGVENEII